MNNNKKNVTLSSGPTTTRVNMIDDWGDYFRSFNSYKPNQQYGTGVVEKPAEGTWETGVPNVITGVNHNISAAQAYMKIKENNIATAHKDYYRNWQEKIEQMEDEFDEHSNLSDEMYKSSNKAPGIKVVEHPANSIEDTLAKIRRAMKLKQARKSDKIESTMFTEEEVKKIQDNTEEAPDVDVHFKKPDVNMADAIMDFIGDDSGIEEPTSETPVEEQEKHEEVATETIEEFIEEQKTEEPVEPEEEKAVETIEELADEEPVVATIEESAIIEEDEQNDNVLVAEESVSGNLEVEIEVPQQEEPEALDPFTEESLEMLQLLEESTMIEENKPEETVETEQEKQEIVEEKPVEPVAEAKATADDSKEKKSANAVSKKSTSSSKPKAKTSAKKKPATSKSKSSKNASKSSKTSKSKK